MRTSVKDGSILPLHTLPAPTLARRTNNSSAKRACNGRRARIPPPARAWLGVIRAKPKRHLSPVLGEGARARGAECHRSLSSTNAARAWLAACLVHPSRRAASPPAQHLLSVIRTSPRPPFLSVSSKQQSRRPRRFAHQQSAPESHTIPPSHAARDRHRAAVDPGVPSSLPVQVEQPPESLAPAPTSRSLTRHTSPLNLPALPHPRTSCALLLPQQAHRLSSVRTTGNTPAVFLVKPSRPQNGCAALDMLLGTYLADLHREPLSHGSCMRHLLAIRMLVAATMSSCALSSTTLSFAVAYIKPVSAIMPSLPELSRKHAQSLAHT